MANICRACACALTILLAAQGLSAQAPGAADETFKQAQQKLREGNADEAIALVRKAADAAPASVQANTQAGVILDLQGRYADARQYFDKAIAAAKPEEKPRALRNMAMSYAFERDCPGAVKYQQQAFDLQLARNDYTGAAEAANEVARVCLESNAHRGGRGLVPQGVRHGPEGGRSHPRPEGPVAVPVGTRPSAHRRASRTEGGSRQARRGGKGGPRQGHESRAGAVSAVSGWLRRVLRRRRQDRAGRAAESQSERPVHPRAHGAGPREAGRRRQRRRSCTGRSSPSRRTTRRMCTRRPLAAEKLKGKG